MDSGADYDGLGMEPSRVLDKYSMEPVDGGSQQHAGQSYVVLAKRSISQKQMDNENRNSFALRALNAEHFMKHLSSGQPLLAPRGDRAPANHSQAPSALGNLLFSKRSIVEGQGESSLVDWYSLRKCVWGKRDDDFDLAEFAKRLLKPKLFRGCRLRGSLFHPKRVSWKIEDVTESQ